MRTKASISDLWFAWASDPDDKNNIRRKAEIFYDIIMMIQREELEISEESVFENVPLMCLWDGFFKFNEDDGEEQVLRMFLDALNNVFVDPDSDLRFDPEWLVLDYRKRL